MSTHTDATQDLYLLYLDADIFVADDPLPLLNLYLAEATRNNLSTDLYCSRPWTTFNYMEFFQFYLHPYRSQFLDLEDSLLDTLNGGTTLYGMCNTGGD